MQFDANKNYTINEAVQLMLQLNSGIYMEIRASEERTAAKISDLKTYTKQGFDTLNTKIDNVEQNLKDEIADLATMTKHALDKKTDLEYA